ncbi:hypothetical protein [Idiomarina piscisalsi]|nr:hypothetical protein [Idiomarina piscisalsi]
MKLTKNEMTEKQEESKALLMLLKLSEEALNDESLTLDEAFDIN